MIQIKNSQKGVITTEEIVIEKMLSDRLLVEYNLKVASVTLSGLAFDVTIKLGEHTSDYAMDAIQSEINYVAELFNNQFTIGKIKII